HYFRLFYLASGVVAARRPLDRSPLRDCFAEAERRHAHGDDRRATADAVMNQDESAAAHLDRLHAGGVVDMHFDLLIDLYEKRNQPGVLVSHFLPEFDAGNIGLIGAAIYVED